MKSSIPLFLSIRNATVKYLDKTVFQDLNFEMLEDQSWAILAGTGAEKTAFMDTILGKTTLTEGRISRKFSEAYQEQQTREGKINSFKDLVAVVSQRYELRNKSNMQDFYYQQRFNASESEEAATVEEYLKQIEGTLPGYWDLSKVLELLQLQSLKDKSLIKLSNGETRRLAIAGALVKNPRLLLMDQPMTGLDVATRREFGKMLATITSSGTQVIMTTQATEIPKAITHVGVLEKGNFKVMADRNDFHISHLGKEKNSRHGFERLTELIHGKEIPLYKDLIVMKDVHIQYGEKVILDQINWRVKQKERWALKGHNGAGKSTLLSLIFGENPQAYANNIILFDRKRGTGESIWDIKRPIGFVSAELHRYFPKNQSCLQVVLSGIFDTIGLFRKTSALQQELAHKWLQALSIDHVADLKLNQISLENQRFCLLARAMIKFPALLILDEAAQGMDKEQRELFKHTVDAIAGNTSVSLIYVSHYVEDIPSTVTREITLTEGRITSIR